MGNEGNTLLNVPVETKETEATMCLLIIATINNIEKFKNQNLKKNSGKANQSNWHAMQILNY